MQTSLLSLINKAQPRRALFTTFTFSISWFETFALPALCRHQCQQIDLLVDYRKAAESTQEAASLHAGGIYRIIPVYMPDSGIFHPKLAYFEGVESDNLVISSGNLTHAGQGKNLEVFDSVNSNEHAAVFEEFSQFLTGLIGRQNLALENSRSIRHFASRAQKVSEESPANKDAQTVWLVHSLERPIAEQLVDLAHENLGALRELTVLSPYHTPSGGPVARLAEQLDATGVRIALSGDSLVAPFKESALLLLDGLTYVAPVTDDDTRFAHAKCFEVSSPDVSLVMTGSVNATIQSLETTKNVEVALIRKLQESPFEWKTVEPKVFEPCDFTSENSESACVALQANWTSDNWISGTVRPAPGSGTAELTLWDREECILSKPIVGISPDGAFQVRMVDTPNTHNGLRLQLANESFSASCWLNVEYELLATAEERGLMKSSSKILSGNYDVADLMMIFSWMDGLLRAQRPAAPAGSVAKPSAASPAHDSSETTNASSYSDWFAESLSNVERGPSANVTRQAIKAAFAWLNRDVLPESTTGAQSMNSSMAGASMNSIRLLDTPKSEFDYDTALPQGSAKDESAEEFCQRLLESLPQALTVDATSAVVPLIVELSGTAALRRARLAPPYYPGQASNASSPRKSVEFWLAKYSQFEYGSRNRQALLPYFCALTCCAVYLNPETSRESLNEALKAIAQRDVSESELTELARAALTTDRFQQLPSSAHELLLAPAASVAQAVTVTEQLHSLINDVFHSSDSAPIRVPPAYANAFSILKQRQRNANPSSKKFGVVVSTPNTKGHCPCCNSTISRDDFSKLRASRLLVCPTCQSPLFFGLNLAKLDQMKLTPHYRSC